MDVPSENSRPACGPGGFIAGRDVRAAFFWLLFFAVQRKVTRARRESSYSKPKPKPKPKPKAKSQKPKAKSQKPRAKSQEPKSQKAKRQNQDGSRLSLG
ncbi:hypothetical protein [Pseudoxanthomonas sacheonensis]|uniref:hypothetical protein n=1 Tax=Pseudoxanthomonas sacheonensis TaxID=443615 RepID=UPI0013CF67AB|nr:hypothetical protein [Pseudoxanthomonas sacheonensis]